MSKEGFRGLVVWQKAKEFAVAIYQLTSEGAIARDFGLRDQMRRAAISVCSNIAEGSAAELISQLEIAKAVGYLSNDDALRLIQTSDEIGKMLRGLIKARSDT